MEIPIRWTPTTSQLQEIFEDLTSGTQWPVPDVDPARTGEDERLKARADWSLRIKASYVTAAQASTLTHWLYRIGAPADLLAGAAYTCRETTDLLAANIHLTTPLKAPAPLTIDDSLIPTVADRPTWSGAFTLATNLFCFNLQISQAIYRAISAICDEPAIAELTARIATSLDELTSYGRAATVWLRSAVETSQLPALKSAILAMLQSYEAVCHGSRQRLDKLAGQAISIETVAGNLGTLDPEVTAAIFYDTVATSILPLIDHLGWDGTALWQRRHQKIRNSVPIAVAAVGINQF